MTDNLHIEYMPLSQLARHPRNPKAHDLGALHTSVNRFGYVAPVLIDERTGLLAAGHGRLDALAQLQAEGKEPPARIEARGGEWYVPVIRGVSFNSDSELEAYLVADNRLTELGGWNEPELAALLQSLADEDEELLRATGYDTDDLQALLDDLTPPLPAEDKGAQIDRAAELQAQWQTERGQLWVIPSKSAKGDHRLLCGDSTNADDVARVMAGDRADICFTSPPYNAGENALLASRGQHATKYVGASSDNLDAGDYSRLLSCFTECALGVSEYVFVNLQMLAGNKLTLVDYLSLFRDHLVDIAVWIKADPPPAMVDNVMTSAFEFVYILSPENRPSRAIRTGDFRGTVSNVFTYTVNHDNDFSDVHSAAFPLAFVEWGVQSFTKRLSRVYDPFGGTGTTMVACEQLGRLARLIEIEPKYCAVILQRMADMGLEPRLAD